jgi:hypothetical protein
VAVKSVWDGVDVAKPRIGAKWEFAGCCMNSGDWTFTAQNPKADEFSLQFSHSDGKRVFSLRCVRDGKKSFRVISSHDWEVVQLDF